MAAGFLLTSLHLPALSGIPADAVQWDFSWSVTDVSILGTPVAAAVAAAEQFVADVHTILGAQLKKGVNVAECRVYDVTAHLDGSPHGSPIITDTFDVTAAASVTALPTELAVALTFRSDYGSAVEFGVGTRPRARHRGRVYIGPLNQTVIDEDATTHRPFIPHTVLTTIAGAATTLKSTADATWSVWSRVNAAMSTVSQGWVDDAWDIQRRRGEETTFRHNW